MKFAFALQKPRQLTRSEAWSCFTANLAIPGSGSLVAGHRIGYAQLCFSLIGLVVFTITSLRFIIWYLQNWHRLTSPGPADDPFGPLVEISHALIWPGIGMAICLLALLWSLATSIQILKETPKNPAP